MLILMVIMRKSKQKRTPCIPGFFEIALSRKLVYVCVSLPPQAIKNKSREIQPK